MLDDIIIIGIVMSLTQLLKRPFRRILGAELCRQITPLVVLVLAAALNAVNAWVFGMGQVPMLHAIAEGIKLGAIAGGIYSMGRAALGMN